MLADSGSDELKQWFSGIVHFCLSVRVIRLSIVARFILLDIPHRDNVGQLHGRAGITLIRSGRNNDGAVRASDRRNCSVDIISFDIPPKDRGGGTGEESGRKNNKR